MRCCAASAVGGFRKGTLVALHLDVAAVPNGNVGLISCRAFCAFVVVP